MDTISTKYLKYLLECPAESHKADYKAAIKFVEDEEFAVKLTVENGVRARH